MRLIKLYTNLLEIRAIYDEYLQPGSARPNGFSRAGAVAFAMRI
ncbi:hypothetical protein [Daejeonella sp.]|nr:hypothetical protein [Daejeonella sp.]MDO8992181.1 hypothetical protein [Daejeonella sp.]MDP2414019.1 hypothetical protein [Daejeonella sp.]